MVPLQKEFGDAMHKAAQLRMGTKKESIRYILAEACTY
jgi:hypothetical protein